MPRRNTTVQQFNPIGDTSKPLYLATKEELEKLDAKVTFLNSIFIEVGIVAVFGFIGVLIALGGILKDYWDGKEKAYINYEQALNKNSLLIEKLMNEINQRKQ